jgi:hypothetical protein
VQEIENDDEKLTTDVSCTEEALGVAVLRCREYTAMLQVMT